MVMLNTLYHKVGVGVALVNHEGKLLLGKRLSRHGYGTWACPGGNLEKRETPEVCAIREVKEETGLTISIVAKLPYVFTYFEHGNIHRTLFVIAKCFSGLPEAKEPNKCKEWLWFHKESLPSPLFPPVISLLSSGRLNF